MAALSGKEGTVSTAGDVHLHITRWNFSETCDAVDVTGMSDGGYRTFVDGLLGATLSADAKWETAPGGAQTGVPPDIETGGVLAFILETDAVPARTISGNCLITSASIDLTVEGDVSYSFEATVVGQWTEV